MIDNKYSDSVPNLIKKFSLFPPIVFLMDKETYTVLSGGFIILPPILRGGFKLFWALGKIFIYEKRKYKGNAASSQVDLLENKKRKK